MPQASVTFSEFDRAILLTAKSRKRFRVIATKCAKIVAKSENISFQRLKANHASNLTNYDR